MNVAVAAGGTCSGSGVSAVHPGEPAQPAGLCGLRLHPGRSTHHSIQKAGLSPAARLPAHPARPPRFPHSLLNSP